jgi:hypothetical protein
MFPLGRGKGSGIGHIMSYCIEYRVVALYSTVYRLVLYGFLSGEPPIKGDLISFLVGFPPLPPLLRPKLTPPPPPVGLTPPLRVVVRIPPGELGLARGAPGIAEPPVSTDSTDAIAGVDVDVEVDDPVAAGFHWLLPEARLLGLLSGDAMGLLRRRGAGLPLLARTIGLHFPPRSLLLLPPGVVGMGVGISPPAPLPSLKRLMPLCPCNCSWD